jgi:hypothetical protein
MSRRHLAREAGLVVERCEVSCHEKRQPSFAILTAFASNTAFANQARAGESTQKR